MVMLRCRYIRNVDLSVPKLVARCFDVVQLLSGIAIVLEHAPKRIGNVQVW